VNKTWKTKAKQEKVGKKCNLPDMMTFVLNFDDIEW
jgi:hypothetical protein